MGCWNGTCCISNMPITSGEPVRVMIIAGKNNVIGFPVKGNYNDYGSVEDIEENAYTEYFTGKFLEMAEGKNSRFSVDWTESDSDNYDPHVFEDILKMVEREYVRYKTYDGKEIECSLFMVRERVYQESLRIQLGQSVGWTGNEKTYKHEIDEKRENFIKACYETGEDLKKAKSEDDRMMASFRRTDVIRPLVEFRDCYVTHQDLQYCNHCIENDAQDYMDVWYDLRVLMTFFRTMRKDIDSPVIGRGSQDASYEELMKFYEFMLKECYEAKKWEDDPDPEVELPVYATLER